MMSVKVVNPMKFEFDDKALSDCLEDIALSIRTKIITRTAKGEDVNHNAFTPYKSATIKYKNKKNITGGVVNLKDTGAMQKMSINKMPKKTQIFISTPNRDMVGFIHQTGQGSMPERYWFGINQADGGRIFIEKGKKYKLVRLAK